MRRAAGVILLRDGLDQPADPTVYLVVRGPLSRFLPGFHSFPGGAAEAGEDEPECARRELAEETGLAVGDELVPAGIKLTPPYAVIRFRAQFYLAALPPGQEPLLPPGGELSSGAWWRPSQALAAWERGEICLAPPTLGTLRELAVHSPREAARRLEETGEDNGVPGPAIPMAPGLFYVPLESETLPPARHTLAVLIGGERLLLVDPAGPHPELLEAIDELSRQGRQVVETVLTHHHPDHVGGAVSLPFPVAAHPETARRLDFPVQRTVGEGETWDLGLDPTGRPWTVQALHTPGHAPGHLALWEGERRFLVAGDMVSGVSTIVIAPPEGDMAAYLASLTRLRQLAPRLVIPAHGPPFGPEADVFGLFLRHRLEREEKVLEALEPAGLELRDVLARAYQDTPESLHPVAALSLQAHLDKLVAEGRAREHGGRWYPARSPAPGT